MTRVVVGGVGLLALGCSGAALAPAADPVALRGRVDVALSTAPDVEATTAIPLEQKIHAMSGVRSVDVDVDADAVLVTAMLDGGADESAVSKSMVDAGLTLVSGGDPDERYMISSDVAQSDVWAAASALVTRLRDVPGVSGLDLCGAGRPEVHVTLDGERLAAEGIAAADVLAAIPTLHTVDGDPLQSLERIAIGPRTLSQTARVSRDVAPVDCSAFAEKPAVLLDIYAPTVKADAIRAAVAMRAATLPVTVAAVTLTAVRVSGANREAVAGALTAAGVTTWAVDERPFYGKNPRLPGEVDAWVPNATAAAPAFAALVGAVAGPACAATLTVHGDDEEVLVDVARKAADELRGLPGVTYVAVRAPSAPELGIALSVAEPDGSVALARALAGAGVRAGMLGDEPIRVVTPVPQDPVEALRAAWHTVDTAHPLEDVATITETAVPAVIVRSNGHRRVDVAWSGTATVDAVRTALVARLQLPVGVSMDIAASTCR